MVMREAQFNDFDYDQVTNCNDTLARFALFSFLVFKSHY